MEKDQSGGFHPPKGKPSAANKVDGLGVSNTSSDQFENAFQYRKCAGNPHIILSIFIQNESIIYEKAITSAGLICGFA